MKFFFSCSSALHENIYKCAVVLKKKITIIIIKIKITYKTVMDRVEKVGVIIGKIGLPFI